MSSAIRGTRCNCCPSWQSPGLLPAGTVPTVCRTASAPCTTRWSASLRSGSVRTATWEFLAFAISRIGLLSSQTSGPNRFQLYNKLQLIQFFGHRHILWFTFSKMCRNQKLGCFIPTLNQTQPYLKQLKLILSKNVNSCIVFTLPIFSRNTRFEASIIKQSYWTNIT